MNGRALKVAAVLWVIWGLVHILAGVMTVSLDTAAAVAGIADAVDPAALQMDYPAAAGAVVKQHGFNLGWIGLTTVVGGVFVWRGSVTAIFVSALAGGCADLGYFLFIDLGGYNLFVPGTVMTLICATAIASSFWAYFQSSDAGETKGASA